MPNYFAPAFRVDINGSRLSADVSKNIQQLSVVSKPNSMDTFSLTVTNPYPELRWTHTSDADLFEQGNAVQISMGYVDDLSTAFDGEITKISPGFPESGNPTLSVEGHTRMHWLQSDRKTRTFQNMTDKQICEQVAREAGLEVEADETGIEHPYVMQPNQSDVDFLRERGARMHFKVSVRGKKLFFQQEQEASTGKYTLVWGHTQKSFAYGDRVLPLKSFNPEMNTLKQVSKVKVRGYNQQTKEPIVGQAGAGDEISHMGGSQPGAAVAAQAFRRQKEEVRVNVPVSSQAEADQQAKALYNDKLMDFVKGTATTIGLPDLSAGHVVSLLGLGPKFSGDYYVEEATHTIGTGGFQTSFTVKRNAI